jgi:hypothetical protein
MTDAAIRGMPSLPASCSVESKAKNQKEKMRTYIVGIVGHNDVPALSTRGWSEAGPWVRVESGNRGRRQRLGPRG